MVAAHSPSASQRKRVVDRAPLCAPSSAAACWVTVTGLLPCGELTGIALVTGHLPAVLRLKPPEPYRRGEHYQSDHNEHEFEIAHRDRTSAGKQRQQRGADANAEALRKPLSERENAGRLGHLLVRQVRIGERAHADHLGRAQYAETEEIGRDQKMRRV